MPRGYRDLASPTARSLPRSASGPADPGVRRSALAHRVFSRLTGLSMEEHRLELERSRIRARLELLETRLRQVAAERESLLARLESDPAAGNETEDPPAAKSSSGRMSLEY